jgi:hypothetical protein
VQKIWFFAAGRLWHAPGAMDDDEAALRNASDNVATPPWFDLCLYVYRNAVKSSKTGLSRTALTEAATGKTGDSAKMTAKFLHEAGEVIEQSKHVFTLLTAEVNLTRHCAAISALPPEHYAAMLSLLLEHGLGHPHHRAMKARSSDSTEVLGEAPVRWVLQSDRAKKSHQAGQGGFALSGLLCGTES